MKSPVTAAVRVLRHAKVAFTPALYDYESRGGTRHSSRCLSVDEHTVIKTLLLEDERKRPLVMLMHGDREVSTKALSRHLGVKSIRPCKPEVADRHSGYRVGGTSPFGLRKAMPIYVERTILELPIVRVNGGKRGFLVELDPRAFVEVLGAQPVDASA